MAPRIGVVTFPGSLDDRDAARAIALAGAERRIRRSDRNVAGAVVLLRRAEFPDRK